MESGESPSPKKFRAMTKPELESLSKEQIIEQYFTLVEQKNVDSADFSDKRNAEEKLKQQQIEATRRENVFVMRLTTKEQEMQEYMNQIQELKQSQMPNVSQLRSTLADPAVNLLFEELKTEVKNTKDKLEETRNELSAWKFTPDSNTGKRLMAKCRLLYQENEELGKMISSGKMAKLEGDLALHKNYCEELKKGQAELDEYLVEVDEEVEGMQSTIVFLQKQLKETREQVSSLEKEKSELQSSLKTMKSDPAKTPTLENNISERTNDNHQSPASDQIKKHDDNDMCRTSVNDQTAKVVVNGDHDQPEPMDTSDSRTTPNGEESSGADSRTKKSNDNAVVDSDTEVQVAQTLAAWAVTNCDNNESSSPPPSHIKSKSSTIVHREDDATAAAI